MSVHVETIAEKISRLQGLARAWPQVLDEDALEHQGYLNAVASDLPDRAYQLDLQILRPYVQAMESSLSHMWNSLCLTQHLGNAVAIGINTIGFKWGDIQKDNADFFVQSASAHAHGQAFAFKLIADRIRIDKRPDVNPQYFDEFTRLEAQIFEQHALRQEYIESAKRQDACAPVAKRESADIVRGDLRQIFDQANHCAMTEKLLALNVIEALLWRVHFVQTRLQPLNPVMSAKGQWDNDMAMKVVGQLFDRVETLTDAQLTRNLVMQRLG